MSRRPIIFLDVDGVLNCEVCFQRYARASGTNKVVGKGHIDVLRTILKKSNAHIVLSSTWRLGFDPVAFNNFLAENGCPGDPVMDRTPVINTMSEPRGREIQTWLNRNSWFTGRFCIIDDTPDMIHLTPKLVHTSWGRGLRREHIGPALKLLTAMVALLLISCAPSQHVGRDTISPGAGAIERAATHTTGEPAATPVDLLIPEGGDPNETMYLCAREHDRRRSVLSAPRVSVAIPERGAAHRADANNIPPAGSLTPTHSGDDRVQHGRVNPAAASQDLEGPGSGDLLIEGPAIAYTVTVTMEDVPGDSTLSEAFISLLPAPCGLQALARAYSAEPPCQWCGDSLNAVNTRRVNWPWLSGSSEPMTWTVDEGLWWIVADRLVRRAGVRELQPHPTQPFSWGYQAMVRTVWPVDVRSDTTLTVRFISTPPDAGMPCIPNGRPCE